MQTRDGITYYFFNLQPFDCHPAADRRATLLRAAKLHVVSGVPQADIMAAFSLSRPTVARVVKRYREHGEDAFFAPRRGRGRTVVDPQMAAEAAKLLASGMSGSACARHLGIPASTFNENRRAGVIADPTRVPAAGAGRCTGGCGHRSPRQRRRSADRPGCGHRSRHSRRPRQARSLGPRGARRRAPHACQRRPDDRGHAAVRPSQLTPSLAAASSRRCRCCCARACSAPPTACSACRPDSTA